MQFGAGDGIERAERLVHQEDGRIGRQGARHAYALALAAGKFARIARGDVGIESDELQQFMQPVRRFDRRPVLNLRNQADLRATVKWGNSPTSWMT